MPIGIGARDTVYIAGDFQGWNPTDPRHALKRGTDGIWTITLPLPAGVPIEFKFTRGGWERVEKGAGGEELSNRTLTPETGQTYAFTVARWSMAGASGPAADRPSTITGHVESFTHAAFLGGRRVWVYLPPGYADSTVRYPVLYMHDGQNLFDARTSFAGEWQVDETCERMIAAGEIPPLIVVGIENGGSIRIREYTPWPSRGGGGGGEAYLRAVRDTLKPEIDRRYRTLPGRSHTWMAGSSLGGLISAYAGAHFADTFGRVACVSPSLWWDDRHMIRDIEANGRPAVERWYQDMGTAERSGLKAGEQGRDEFVAELEQLRELLLRQGFRDGVDFMSVVGQGHRHHESAWAERLPALLRFLAAQAGAGPDR